MGICPHCQQSTLVGHFHGKSWRIDMVIDEPDACDPLPIPFLADHGCHLFPERGKHALRLGYSCHVAAIEYGQRVFPEARVVQVILCDFLGEPVEGSDAVAIPVD